MYVLLSFEIVLGLASLFLLKRLLDNYALRQELPPGPKGLPVLGNIFDMPTHSEKAWLHWQKLKKLYGPVSSVTVLGQTIVILNDYGAALELLEKNSVVCANRPTFTLGSMIGWNKIIAFHQYDNHHRQCRRDLHQYLGTYSAVAGFGQILEVENKRFLSKVLQDNASFRDHIRRTAGAIALRLAYGYIAESTGPDRLITIADVVMTELARSILPGVWAVEFLPFLRHLPEWLPGMGFKRAARRWRKQLIEFVDQPYQFTKQCIASGTAATSYVSTTLSSLASPPTAEDEFRVKWVAAAIYSGGSDTSVSAISTFFLAMVLHPHVQREAQNEIDSIVGTDRLPTAEDRVRLPYVEAVLKECLRWYVVGPLSMARASSKEHVFRGYRIPKGSIVMPNIWEFSHDPKMYANPDVFNPDRFLSVGGGVPELDPRNYVFGFGRRICSGKEFADASMWLTVATSLAVFNIETVCDELGNEVTPSVEYDNGFICHPKDFPCSIVSRSAKSEALIRSVDYEYPYEKSDADALSRVRWGND